MIDWRQLSPVAVFSLLATAGGVVLLAYPSDFAADRANQVLVAGMMSIPASLLIGIGLLALGVSPRRLRWLVPTAVVATAASLVVALQLAGTLWINLLIVAAELIVLAALGILFALLDRRRRSTSD
ncbi:hypothetical protein [Kribbella sp. CA-294648]|uniref:hypothetical protein n=1 Tax=Kribbella sp. CA-294648 TaxID=3239948 RepID=UPI003D8F3612